MPGWHLNILGQDLVAILVGYFWAVFWTLKVSMPKLENVARVIRILQHVLGQELEI